MTAATSRLRRRGIGAGVAALVGLGSIAGLAGAAQAAPGFDPSASSAQVAGVDRFDTAARIATATFTTAQTVVIANGDRVIDAQAAGYIAGQQTGGAPILLTQTGSVPQYTLDAIKKLGATKAIVIGDTVSVSTAARAQLTAAGLTLTSIAGDNRFDTAADIYNSASTKSKTVFLARGDYLTGQVSPDALAAGPIAYKGTPILLTNANSLPSETRQALIDGGVTNVVVLGNGITDAVKSAVSAAVPGVSVSTIAGSDRSVTAQLLAESSYGSFYNRTSASIANGEKVDALAAGPWAAVKGTPILLTLGTNQIGPGTTAYLDKYKSTLVSATVFGDSNSVPATFISQASTAANGGPVTSVTVTTGVTSGAFSYADPTTKAAVSVTPKSTDTFTVNGTPATLGAFLGQISIGDSLVITPGSSSNTYALTNKADTDYTSGLVGNVNTGATGTDPVFSLIEPITGAVLRSFPATAAFPAANTFYTVDGTNATSATFLAALSEGDTISVTGAGTSASPYTYALTNAIVTGTVTSATPGTSGNSYVSTFGVKTAAGATLGDIAGTNGDTVFQTASTDVLTVDGATATAQSFAEALTNGDTISYSRTGGVQTIALKNAAPTASSGTYISGAAPTSSTPTNIVLSSGAVTVPQSYLLTVDGAVATAAEFNAALTPGDQVTFQAADSGTGTSGTVKLVNADLVGSVSSVNTSNKTVTVKNSDGVTIAAAFNYSAPAFFANNTTSTWYVNGTAGTAANFETELATIANGSKTGTITVTDNGTVTEHRLVTTNVTTAPAAVGTSPALADGTLGTAASATSSSGALVLPFNKPVYWSAAPAQGDFTLTGNAATVANPASITAVSPTFSTSADNLLRATLGASQFTTGSGASTLTVTLTAQGAAKIKDANGVAAAAGTNWTITTS